MSSLAHTHPALGIVEGAALCDQVITLAQRHKQTIHVASFESMHQVQRFTWPRSSPPGCLLVRALMYHSPLVRSLACACVSTALPLTGLSRFPLNGSTMPAFWPGAV